jgi:hypothetical protein
LRNSDCGLRIESQARLRSPLSSPLSSLACSGTECRARRDVRYQQGRADHSRRSHHRHSPSRCPARVNAAGSWSLLAIRASGAASPPALWDSDPCGSSSQYARSPGGPTRRLSQSSGEREQAVSPAGHPNRLDGLADLALDFLQEGQQPIGGSAASGLLAIHSSERMRNTRLSTPGGLPGKPRAVRWNAIPSFSRTRREAAFSSRHPL